MKSSAGFLLVFPAHLHQAGEEPAVCRLQRRRSVPEDLLQMCALPVRVKDVEEALQGARDIVAERLSETALIRENLRGIYRTRRVASKVTKAGESSPDAAKYRSYFNYFHPIAKIPSYNLLALLRAENEGFLKLDLDADPEKCGNKIYYDYCQAQGYPAPESGREIRLAADSL